jgi:hypothetical protein
MPDCMDPISTNPRVQIADQELAGWSAGVECKKE